MQEYDDKVLRQQEAIRQSGMINMLDKVGVRMIAEDMGYTELAEFIEQASESEYMDMADRAAEVMSE